jgi:Fe2+ or Zn2+ uptake regulation protein
VQINPRTTAKDLVKMLEETGINASISTVKRVLYQHKQKGLSTRKKPLLQKREVWEWQHHVVGVLCCRRDWCTSQNRSDS